MSAVLTAAEWAQVLSAAKHLSQPPASGHLSTSIGEQFGRREDALRATVERIIAAHLEATDA